MTAEYQWEDCVANAGLGPRRTVRDLSAQGETGGANGRDPRQRLRHRGPVPRRIPGVCTILLKFRLMGGERAVRPRSEPPDGERCGYEQTMPFNHSAA